MIKLIIAGGIIIFFLAVGILMLSGKSKKYEAVLKLKGVSGKKIFWFAFVGGVCYGIYLFICLFLPTSEQKVFKELSKNLAEIELKPEKDKLATLNERIKKGGILTEAEKREVMEADEKIKKVRKDYSDGKLISAPPKPVTAQSKEEIWDWAFEWEATAEQLASNKKQEKGLINNTCFISCNDFVLKFKYKRPSGKIVELTLDRDDPETEFYFGRVSQSDLYLRVWLVPDKKGNFEGHFDNGPNTNLIEVFLKNKI